jgi:peptidoglycan/LPS O-acetylase OafA/YrhL
MNDLFAERVAGIPWVVLAGVALVVALVYAVLPAGEGAEGAAWVIIRWSHTVAWLFFAAAALARSRVTSAPMEWAAPLAATGGLVYIVFMVTVTSAAGG